MCIYRGVSARHTECCGCSGFRVDMLPCNSQSKMNYKWNYKYKVLPLKAILIMVSPAVLWDMILDSMRSCHTCLTLGLIVRWLNTHGQFQIAWSQGCTRTNCTSACRHVALAMFWLLLAPTQHASKWMRKYFMRTTKAIQGLRLKSQLCSFSYPVAVALQYPTVALIITVACV